jgi:hypothetical protein
MTPSAADPFTQGMQCARAWRCASDAQGLVRTTRAPETPLASARGNRSIRGVGPAPHEGSTWAAAPRPPTRACVLRQRGGWPRRANLWRQSPTSVRGGRRGPLGWLQYGNGFPSAESLELTNGRKSPFRCREVLRLRDNALIVWIVQAHCPCSGDSDAGDSQAEIRSGDERRHGRAT